MRVPGVVYPWEDGESTREERRAALRARDLRVKRETIRKIYEEKAEGSDVPEPPAQAATPAARGAFFLRRAKRKAGR